MRGNTRIAPDRACKGMLELGIPRIFRGIFAVDAVLRELSLSADLYKSQDF